MKSKGVSLSQRGEEARSRWHKHVVAQRASGQAQVAYCRAQGPDPGYLSVWKRKLAVSGAVASAAASRSLRLVPLVVKAEPVESPVLRIPAHAGHQFRSMPGHRSG